MHMHFATASDIYTGPICPADAVLHAVVLVNTSKKNHASEAPYRRLQSQQRARRAQRCIAEANGVRACLIGRRGSELRRRVGLLRMGASTRCSKCRGLSAMCTSSQRASSAPRRRYLLARACCLAAGMQARAVFATHSRQWHGTGPPAGAHAKLAAVLRCECGCVRWADIRRASPWWAG